MYYCSIYGALRRRFNFLIFYFFLLNTAPLLTGNYWYYIEVLHCSYIYIFKTYFSCVYNSYILRRLRHSLGEVCCLCIDEIVSFPAEANIKVRLVVSGQAHATLLIDAQAFLSIKKI